MGYKLGGYTIEEIQDWFLNGKHNKKMQEPVNEQGPYVFRINSIKPEGLFLQRHNTVIVLKRGKLHNDQGPAKVIFTKKGKPYYSIFAKEGNILPWDDLSCLLRNSQVKRLEMLMNKDEEDGD
jgi:hypothetical protein